MVSKYLALPLLLCLPSLTLAFLENSIMYRRQTSPKATNSRLPVKSLQGDQDIEENLHTLCLPDISERRGMIAGLSSMLLPVLIPGKSWAADSSSPFSGMQQADSVSLEDGLLESRVTENLLSPPSYGMETPDVFYPSWFAGSWKIASKTIDVQAPCGIPLFGGNTTYEKAKNEVGTTLSYDSRFISDATGRTIADREYNVRKIAQAAMGQYSVLDIPIATPNKLTCILAPVGSPRMLKVDLIALNRRQERISDLKFDCSEVTREIISAVNSSNSQNGPPTAAAPSATILKEVETTSLYTFNAAKNEIRCQQRSATFLLPSQSSPIAYKMWEATRGRPIDTRFYDVSYSKAS